MIDPFDAIESLVAQAQRRVDFNNEQPHRKKVTIAETLEAKTAELLSHLVRDRKAPYHFTVHAADEGWVVCEIRDDIVIRRLVVHPSGGVFTSTSGRQMMVNGLGILAEVLRADDLGDGLKRYGFGA